MTNGLFMVTLDFGAGIFNGSNYWLEVSVRTNGAGGYTTLAPLQSLTPVAVCNFRRRRQQRARGGAERGLERQLLNAVSFNNAANSFTGNGGGLTNVNAATLGGLSAGQFWKITGNSNTVAGVNFLGTADNQPLELKVNATRALRVEPGGTNGPNVVWGHPANSVTVGVVGAVIGGGGGTVCHVGSCFHQSCNRRARRCGRRPRQCRWR